jgi:hypothetical protein
VEGDRTDAGAEPLVFRGRLTEEDAVALLRCRDRVLVRRSIRWLARGFAAALGGLMTWFMLDKGPGVVAVLTVGCCAYVLFGLPFERAWAARRYYRRHAADHLETEVRLSTDRVSVSNDVQQTEFAWHLLGGLADAPAGVLFYSQARQPLLWLPARLLEGNDLRARVLALAAANGVRVSRV